MTINNERISLGRWGFGGAAALAERDRLTTEKDAVFL